ncbi:MAG TPA: presenilin family intramembrane aspartyl protease PSH [Desulfobacteria bacterium]|nr:presenilin family intramembrane aspartyl protease PSH [Desulfobacteria bacterium]
MTDKTGEGAKKEEQEERSTGIVLFIGMGCFILITQIIALLLATPFDVAGMIAFENPDDLLNPIIFFVFIIAFTAFILIVLKYFKNRGEKLVYFVMLAAVAMTIYYVMLVLFPFAFVPELSTLALALLLYKYPEWYVIDATGLIIGGGAAALFGISLGILPVLLLLDILMVYDAIAVYKTKHMVTLAESVIDLHMPVLFVLPRKWSFSLLRGDAMEDGFYMGLGDAIIPTVLVVSANYMPGFVYYFGLINAPALGALIGTLVGYAVLSRIAGRGKPHAGLPFLNSGAMLGFAIGYLAMVV